MENRYIVSTESVRKRFENKYLCISIFSGIESKSAQGAKKLANHKNTTDEQR